MKTIWKYSILSGNRDGAKVEIMMKKGAKILYLDEQNNDICMWAEVDTEAEEIKRYFQVVGTGHEINQNMGTVWEYVGSAKVEGGKFVFHIFERIS